LKIQSFAHKGAEAALRGRRLQGVPSDAANKLREMLEYLDDMESPEELRALTAWKVHTPTGDRKRDVEPERYPKSPSDVLYRYCRTRNLRREFRGLPRTQETRAAMPIKNAPHSGEFIRMGIIEPAGLSGDGRGRRASRFSPGVVQFAKRQGRPVR